MCRTTFSCAAAGVLSLLTGCGSNGADSIPIDEERRAVVSEDAAASWNLAFHRQSTVDPATGKPNVYGTDGWRMADGGQAIELPRNRVLWMWGDTFTTWLDEYSSREEPIFGSHYIAGSTVAVSGLTPPSLLGPSIHFYARYPVDGSVVDITTGSGVQQLRRADADFPWAGGWMYTGNERSDDASVRDWRWFLGGIDIDGTLHLIYQTVGCSDPVSGSIGDSCGFRWTGYNLEYRVYRTEHDTISDWVFDGAPTVLNDNLSGTAIKWTSFVDDRAHSDAIYAFGIGPGDVNSGNLYAARIRRKPTCGSFSACFSVYRSWEFLHEGSPDNWIAGNDDVTGDASTPGLRVLATNVAQEFSVHRITIRDVSRWVLAHAYWPRSDRYESGMPTDLGVLRISGADDFVSLSDDERDFIWFDANDREPELAKARANALASAPDVPYSGGLFRGFSAYPMLSQLPKLLVGYTLFAPHSGPPNLDCASDPACNPYGNIFCGDHEGPCGARRFAHIDLSDAWPGGGV